MRYLIDANNLAGKMRMLGSANFDQSLIGIIKRWPKLKSNRVILVFDPVDTMGDKETLGNLTIIYTPRDDYYKSADDKIIELVEAYLYKIKEAKILRDELTVITDDAGIKKRIEEINHQDIHFQSSATLADKLLRIVEQEECADDADDEEDGSRGLGGKDMDKINDELRKIWR